MAKPTSNQPADDPRSSGKGQKNATGDGAQQFLTFHLAGEMYALSIANAKEVIEYGQLTSLPMMPGSMRGVINLRGAVVPVIDLAARFHGTSSEVQRRTCIVIVEVAKGERRIDVGIMVDAVSEVLEIADAEIEPAPSFAGGIDTDFIEGMGKVKDKFVIVLDIQRCLSVEEMQSLTRIGRQGAEAVSTAEAGLAEPA